MKHKMNNGGGVKIPKKPKMAKGGGVGGGRSNPNSVKMPMNGNMKGSKMAKGGGVNGKKKKMSAAQKLAQIKKILGG